MHLSTSEEPVIHVCFYSPKGGQGVSTVAAAFALFSSRFGARVTLRSHDPDAMETLLAVAHSDAPPAPVNAATELAGLDWPADAPVVVDDCGRGGDADPDATLVMVLRPCYLALHAAVESLSRCSRRPDSLLVVAEPDRALGPNDLADALCVPVAAVVPLDPAVARAVDSGLRGALDRPRTPRSLQPLLDLAGRLLSVTTASAVTALATPGPADVSARGRDHG